MNEMLAWWAGDGGSDYATRNDPTPSDIDRRAIALGRALANSTQIATALEVGCGPGGTLAALRRVLPATRLWAVEPNGQARRMAAALVPDAVVLDGHAESIPAADATFDLTVGAGLLIHVPPDRLAGAMCEIARVSRRYVLAIEYFAPAEEPIVYYGATRIWRRDYGRLYVEHTGLRPVSWGFFWRGLGDTGDGFDSTVWHLLEKPQ